MHKNPEQMRRLVERLRHPEVDLYVHVDAKFDPAPFDLPGTILLEKRFPIYWAGFGFIRVYLDLFDRLVKEGRHGRITMLSGQDYPLHPIDRIVRDLRETDGECIDLGWSHEDRRYRYEVFWVYPHELPFLRRFQDRLLRKFWYRDNHWRRLPPGLEFACGSAFWSLSLPAAAYLLERTRREPKVVRFFENTFAPDEMFFQILLRDSPLRDRLGPSKHYVDWSKRAEHPKTLGLEDLESMNSSGALFARKFEPDAPVLDELDRLAGWKGSVP